ncbi:CPBP family intramembrane metalloprotease [Gillisia marina]|uniref:CPBP family intramembrane metalloprotease n=1 Tax=Gillisia marina TaxID=1167637 RepID=UPI00029AB3E6|nr:CPBP family intramembrane metalloprotease [Gillisia marina]
MNYPLIKPKYYISLFKEIFNFVKNPNTNRNLTKSTKQKIYDTIGLLFIKMLFLIPVVLFFAVIYDPENIQNENMSERFTPIILLLVGVVILPFLEEVLFRLSLRFKPHYLALTSSVFCYYILTKLIFHTKFSAVDESFLLRVVISVSLGIVLYPIMNIKSLKTALSEFWALHFRSIYYISCLVFAWMHYSKYEISWTNVLLLPILTLPQLMSAIIYGYIRVSYGFQYPLLLHMSNNLLGFSASFLFAKDLI